MITRLTLLLAAALSLSSAFAEPKKLLVVTVTTGFRHSSIETAEKVLAELGASSGAWTVDYRASARRASQRIQASRP
jgi:hypothetical protein